MSTAQTASDPGLAARLADQRLATDDDFLDRLRLPGAAGKRLRAARAAGDRAALVAAVADHFRTRAAPRWPFYMHGTPWMELNGRGKVLDKARALLGNQLKSSWPPYAVGDLGALTPGDWQRAFTRPHGGGTISRTTFLPELTTAFALTGDVAYLHKAKELLRSFGDAFPFVLEDGFDEDHDRHFGGGPNSAGDVFARSTRWLDLMHSGALHVPGVFSDEDVFWLIKQLWFAGEQYHRLVGDALRRDNHHLTDHGEAPLFFGVMFPEFAGARERVAYARTVIRHHFKHNLLPDDCYVEHCTKYQYHIFYMYFQPWSVARANGVPLFTPKEEKRFANWIEFLARMTKPDGVLADFGDEFGGQLGQLFTTLGSLVMTPRLAAIGRALGYEASTDTTATMAEAAKRMAGWHGEPTRFGLTAWYGEPAAKVKAVKPPEPATATWPHGGFTSFRSAWTKDADFLAVAHYRDSIAHGHTHWDMLSFVLHAGGRTLIGDPATWLYTDGRIWDGPQARENRGYSYAVDAHNCLVMDDDTLKPLRALGHPCSWGGQPPKHGTGIFSAGGAIELLEAWHDAYAPTRHRRFMAHVRGVGFVFADLLSRDGLDLRPHQYSQRFHLEGGVQPSSTEPEANAPVRIAAGDAACWIVPGRGQDASWRAWRDARLDNLYGVPDSPGGPWVLELTRRIEGPAAFITVLATHAPTVPTARALEVRHQREMFRQHDGYAADLVDLGDEGTLAIATCPYGKPLVSAEFATDAEFAIVHRDRRGKVVSWAMARGSRLSIGGKTLAKGKRRELLIR